MNMRDFWAAEAAKMRDTSHLGIAQNPNEAQVTTETELRGSVYRCNDDGTTKLYKRLPQGKGEYTYIIAGKIKMEFDNDFEAARAKYDTTHPDIFLLPTFDIRQEIAKIMAEYPRKIEFELGGMIYRTKGKLFHIRAENGEPPTTDKPAVVEIRKRYKADIYVKRWNEIERILGREEFLRVKGQDGEPNLDRFAIHTWHSHPDMDTSKQPPSANDVSFAGSDYFTNINTSHYVLSKGVERGRVYLYRNNSPKFDDAGRTIGYASGFLTMEEFYKIR